MQGFHPKILKQAYSLTRDHKIFWLAGLFLVWPNFARAVAWIYLFTVILNVDGYSQTSEVYEGSTLVGFISIVVISLMIAYYYRSRAVVNVAVKQLRDHPQVEKSKVYQEADPLTWELIKFGFTSSVGMILLVAFLASPVMYLTANNFSTRALILGLFAFGVFLPIFTVIYYSMVFVPMFVVVHRTSAGDAFRISFDLVKRNWVWLVFTSVLLLGIELLAILVGVIVMYLVSYAFVIFGQIFYDVGGYSMSGGVQVLVAIIAFGVFFITQAFVAVFQRIVWAILFFEIVKPVKTEEIVEVEPVPEILSQ